MTESIEIINQNHLQIEDETLEFQDIPNSYSYVEIDSERFDELLGVYNDGTDRGYNDIYEFVMTYEGYMDFDSLVIRDEDPDNYLTEIVHFKDNESAARASISISERGWEVESIQYFDNGIEDDGFPHRTDFVDFNKIIHTSEDVFNTLDLDVQHNLFDVRLTEEFDGDDIPDGTLNYLIFLNKSTVINEEQSSEKVHYLGVDILDMDNISEIVLEHGEALSGDLPKNVLLEHSNRGTLGHILFFSVLGGTLVKLASPYVKPFLNALFRKNV